MAIIKRNQKNRSQEVNEKEINPNEKIKSTEFVDENEKDRSVKPHISKIIRKSTKKFIPIDEDDLESEEVQDEEKVELPSSSKKKVIGKGGRISKSPVVEESELEDDSDLYEEEEETTSPPSSKGKVIGKGGRISKPPVVEKSKASSAYSDLEDLEEDNEEDNNLSYYLDKLHEDETDEELEDDLYEETTESDFNEDELYDDISQSDTYEDEEEEVILKASKRKKLPFILDREQFSEKDVTYVSNIPTVPINIESYETVTITENEAQIVKKFGIKSIKILDGEILPVKVIGTESSFAMLEKSDECCSLKWISDFIQLENKSKSTNGKVFVDLINTDELGTKKTTVPVSTLTDKYKIKTISNYDIHVSPIDSITVAVALR